MAKKRKYRKANNHKKRTVILSRDERSGVLVARDGNDRGTEERANHGGGVVVSDRVISSGGIVVGKGVAAVGENIVDWLSHQGYLDPEQEAIELDERFKNARKWRIRAAEWITTACHDACLMGRIIGLYSTPTSGGQHEITKKEAQAKKMLQSLFKRFGSRAERLVDVCFFNSPIPDNEIPKFVKSLDAVAEWRRLIPEKDEPRRIRVSRK